MSANFVVLGAGGHAKVVVSTIEAAGGKVVGILDDDRTQWGRAVLGHVVRGPIDASAIPSGAAAIIAVGSNRRRAEIAERMPLNYGTAIHPSAVIHSSVAIEPGVVVFAGVIVQADCRVGAHSIVNTSASIDHDCVVGSCAHIAPGVRVAGGVVIGDGALLGIGTSVIPGMSIGAWATVGAGSVIVRAIPGGVVAAGNPARILKE